MDEYSDGSLAAFWKRLRRSPVRWVVLAHAMLLAVVIILRSAAPFPGLRLLDSSLVMAQGALLLIWATLDERATTRRMLGVAFVVAVIQVVDSPMISEPAAFLGLICLVPSMFFMLTILALPLSFAQSMGLQLQRFSSHHMPPPRRLQFSIRSVLLVSIGVAVLFGLKGVPEMLDRQPGADAHQIAFALAIVVMVLVVSSIYLTIPLVAVWVVLTPGKILPRLAIAVVGWGLGVVLVYHYTQISEGAFHPSLSASATALALLILLATLFMLQRLGYRAVWLDRDGWNLLEEIPAGSPFGTSDNVLEDGSEGGYPG